MGLILLTMHTEDNRVVRAIRAGTRAYVLKTQAAEELVPSLADADTAQLAAFNGHTQTNGYMLENTVTDTSILMKAIRAIEAFFK